VSSAAHTIKQFNLPREGHCFIDEQDGPSHLSIRIVAYSAKGRRLSAIGYQLKELILTADR
jgi:hypothetical protein